MAPEAGRAEEANRAAGLKKAPLDGFMGEADWNGVCLETRTRGGVFWPIPDQQRPSLLLETANHRRRWGVKPPAWGSAQSSMSISPMARM